VGGRPVRQPDGLTVIFTTTVAVLAMPVQHHDLLTPPHWQGDEPSFKATTQFQLLPPCPTVATVSALL